MPDLIQLPVELQSQVFAHIKYPAAFAATCKHIYTLSTIKSVRRLWLWYNAEWLEEEWTRCVGPRSLDGHVYSKSKLRGVPYRMLANPDFVETFLDMRGKDANDIICNRILQWSVPGNHARIVEKLLSRTPRLHIPSQTVEALFLSSAVAGYTAILKCLVTHRFEDVSRRLHLAGVLASRHGRADVVRFLCFETSCDPFLERPNGLELAAVCGHVEVVRILVQVWARKKLQGVDQSMVKLEEHLLRKAVDRGNVEVVGVLLESGFTWGMNGSAESAFANRFDQMVTFSRAQCATI
ncbi:uncharacterized protein SPPG_04497 [Spizellomyces punctatus DAOM BR117]|uniref:F-box domain-containing protein n=1 Tax=Spizellomyces punctatus (strain DAOM BR117) TaxID=645134 RepID=A0A0L0HFB4_SPIPD|nr:uncharacterized protein SPPG_04497 [Spizellomyces punctatus DAOM BR117]KND00156.1 hypothetical protein SPPG_04497 [Spizellomyces punctatus DAOM BR117]|eukprot:XP_016608195.1 hypothetical protein SPPG_04497 [Spizellomyces punctatus DAOM BR117]